jgi:hypothetical protein
MAPWEMEAAAAELLKQLCDFQVGSPSPSPLFFECLPEYSCCNRHILVQPFMTIHAVYPTSCV